MKRNTIILCFFVLLKFVLQYLLINPVYDLHRDEYLYLDQAKHLAWGYMSVPPLTSWVSYIIMLLGNSEFWVKFFPALFGALTVAVVWKTIETLKGNLFALLLASCAITFSAILRINILYQPNSFDVLAWTAFYSCIIHYIVTSKNKWLLYAAVVMALGFLNKYNVVFMLIGLLPAILLTPQRKIFSNRYTYLAAALAFIIVLPNLIWQYQNGFPVRHHMELLSSTQLENNDRLNFVKEQLLFFISSWFVIIAGLVAMFIYQPLKKFQFFFWSLLITLAVFIYLKAKGYYAIGLYPIYLVFGSIYLENLFANGWKKYLKPAAIIFVIALSIPMLRIAFPTMSPEKTAEQSQRYKSFGLLRWEDGKEHEMPQDFADMLGWKELAAKVDSLYATLDTSNTLVYCDNYGETGAINYYSKFKHINAVSENADYLHWFNFSKPISNIIMVKDEYDDDIQRTREKAFFDTVMLTGKIENKYAREYGTRIYLLRHANINVADTLKREIEEDLEEWKH